MMTATYSPEDNKLRLYPASRLDAETYARVRAAGFIWAPKQELFVAPSWTPDREDLLLELAGDVGDEDVSLCDRAEERAERFEGYSASRSADADAAQASAQTIMDGIPLGQPILVGHHSEKHARKDAERIENGLRRAVKMWDTATYWTRRAEGAIASAKYKERPDVRARRIKTLEAERRKMERQAQAAEAVRGRWLNIHDDALTTVKRKDGSPSTFEERVRFVLGNSDSGGYSVYSDYTAGKITAAEAQARVLTAADGMKAWTARWLAHYDNRLTYERAMLADSGGTVAQQTGPEVGGAVRCWASPGYGRGWAYVQKVNRVTVTVLDSWQNDGRTFRRTVPFDKLAAVMTRAQVEAACQDGSLHETANKAGFLLAEPTPIPSRPAPEREESREKAEAVRETLRHGVKVVTAPNLFPTPRALAVRMVDLAGVQPGHRVLEPSAGTGELVAVIVSHGFLGFECGGRLVTVEINSELAEGLREQRRRTLYANGDNYDVRCGDFLECNGDLGTFDRVLMNPPFDHGSDLRHILHALAFLKPGGRLVAICANGPRQQAELQSRAESWEELPAGTFAGTNVRAVLLSMTA